MPLGGYIGANGTGSISRRQFKTPGR